MRLNSANEELNSYSDSSKDIFEDITIDDLREIAKASPCFRGYAQGYLAEIKLMKYLRTLPDITNVGKIPDNDKHIKGDITLEYKGTPLVIELKSLATATIRYDVLTDSWVGSVSCKNSDSRKVDIDGVVYNGSYLNRTTFDILGVSTFAATGKWECIYLESRHLPESISKDHIKTSFTVNPFISPYVHRDVVGVLEAARNYKINQSLSLK